jgi:hypothetical protein
MKYRSRDLAELKFLVLALKEKVGMFETEVIVEESATQKRVLRLLVDTEHALHKLEQFVIADQ